jgi:hypothetical protein
MNRRMLFLTTLAVALLSSAGPLMATKYTVNTGGWRTHWDERVPHPCAFCKGGAFGLTRRRWEGPNSGRTVPIFL